MLNPAVSLWGWRNTRRATINDTSSDVTAMYLLEIWNAEDDSVLYDSLFNVRKELKG